MTVKSVLQTNLVPEGRGARIALIFVLALILAAVPASAAYALGFSLIPPMGWTPVEGAVTVGAWTFGICTFIGLLGLLFQPTRTRSLSTLRKALSNTDSLMRASAAYELGCMGGDSATALGDLMAMSCDRDDTVRIWARWAVGKISRTRR